MPEWLIGIENLNIIAQIATIGGFLLALLTAVLVFLGKFLAVLRKLGSGVLWIMRGFKSKPEKPLLVRFEQPPQPEPLPVAPAGLINIPPGRTVIGRDEEVAELREKLMASSGGSVSLVNSGVVLRGQGGLGKSTLARRYAEVHGGAYDGVIWVEALTRQAIIKGLVALCGHLGLEAPDTPQLQHAQEVLARIARSGQRWLFIYDNVETYADLKDLLPPPGAHLIVTTRQGEGWPGFEVMPLDRLGADSEDAPAVSLLMREAGQTDGAAEAQALAEDLGGLPLALVVAGALIKSTGESFSAYRERLAEILNHTPDNEDYPTSVLGAVQMSYEQLPEDARLVADLCAWWAAEGLEPALLTDAPDGWRWEKCRADIPEAIQSLAQDDARVRAAFAALTGRSLLESGEGAWSMHRMTAAALRHLQQDREDGVTAKAAAALLAAVYPRDPNVSATWSACTRLTPHVRALWACSAAPETEVIDYLFHQAALYLGKIADFPGDLEMSHASFILKEKRLPESHVDVATSLGDLGLALLRVGELDQAESHLARAVELDEVHRPDTVELAHSYDQHGAALAAMTKVGDAPALSRSLRRRQQALVLFRQIEGRIGNGTAQVLNNLAFVRNLQGRTAAAARLSQAGLAIDRKVLDPGDARLGYSLMNTGAYWLVSGSVHRAEPLLREALELWQKVFTAQPQHPETRNAADWLISCLFVLARAGDDADARRAEARALCDRYGYDFAEREELAKQYPLAPPAD